MSDNDDILEEEEERKEEGEWVAAVARGVGNVVASVSDAIRKVSVGLPQRPSVPRRRQHRTDVRRMLRSLGRVVSAHEPSGFESLEGDPEFWRLVGQLSRAPRRVRPGHVADVTTSLVGDVVDADVVQDGVCE